MIWLRITAAIALKSKKLFGASYSLKLHDGDGTETNRFFH